MAQYENDLPVLAMINTYLQGRGYHARQKLKEAKKPKGEKDVSAKGDLDDAEATFDARTALEEQDMGGNEDDTAVNMITTG
jgi:hypothetical protein